MWMDKTLRHYLKVVTFEEDFHTIYRTEHSQTHPHITDPSDIHHRSGGNLYPLEKLAYGEKKYPKTLNPYLKTIET